MKKPLILILLTITWLSSCSPTKEIIYFQDADKYEEMVVNESKNITVQPNDLISIVVKSKDPQLAILFNLPIAQARVANIPGQQAINTTNDISGYTINSKGNIDFPILGEIHVGGLNREEIALKIKTTLIDKDLVRDPIVTVGFINLTISVLGEVKTPGKYFIQKDQVTLLEGLGMAGDLAITGRRDRVAVMRVVDGKRKVIYHDLRSMDTFNSQFFYLQQGDIIYVEPNNKRANESTINGNTILTVTTWITISSFLTSLAVLIVNLTDK